ncbi:hypothetical protein DB30_05606 [Enhygromyxa salina]|uniref:Uncharacterized protein n=1 Tax=Enhygromyxa salina TaxID=215803 RepID=A0A0C2D0N2_9BACT|nr:hypothetical protein DB30_05606 [Enhygromyxa salina]
MREFIAPASDEAAADRLGSFVDLSRHHSESGQSLTRVNGLINLAERRAGL